MIIISVALAILGTYLSAYCSYVLFLMIMNRVVPESNANSQFPERSVFRVLIPAHNEEMFLKRLLVSLDAVGYDKKKIGIIVVADNCSDRTVEIAREYPVKVLERKDSIRKGKGYALEYALAHMDDQYDALFIVDADSVVDPCAFAELDKKLQEGGRIIQCYNGVYNVEDSWLTRLMSVSRAIGNDILEHAKEKIGLTSHLMGNGMCFCRDVVRKYGWDAFTVGEDWEFFARMVREGERIRYAKHARVFHQESVDFLQATSQRMRWSRGRFHIARKAGFTLLTGGLLGLQVTKSAASLELLFPNPSLGLNLTAIGTVISISVGHYRAGLWFTVLMFLQFLLFLDAAMHTENKWLSIVSLFVAPVFMIWKMAIDVASVLGLGKGGWARTRRK